MLKLAKLLQQLQAAIPQQQLTNTNVSEGSVGWHIEHSLLTINAIIDNVVTSNPAKYKWAFNLSRLYVFTLQKIPIGKVKAPSIVQPKNDYTTESLTTHLAITKTKIEHLTALKPNNYFVHPFFGKLKLSHTITFLQIHTKHHLNIINDIIKSSNY